MRTMLLISAMALIIGTSCPAFGQEISGGIVFSDGKEVFYYDLQTSQKASLLSDLVGKDKKPLSTLIASISENGKILVWLDSQGQLWARTTPKGKPFLTPTKQNSPRPEYSLKDIPIKLSVIPKTLLASYDGRCVAYEIRTKPNDYYFSSLGSNASDLLVESTVLDPDAGTVYVGEDNSSFGVSFAPFIFGHPGCKFNVPPYFPTWSKKGTNLAFICKKDGKWGPIVIVHDDKSSKEIRINKLTLELHCIEEKNISLSACEGLAWRLDGTISYLSAGTLYSEDGKVIAKGIEGTGLTWISEDSFIFRGKGGNLYIWSQAWDQGSLKKLSVSVPEVFSYCFQSPFDPDKKVARKVKNGEEKEAAGQGKFDSSGFVVGSIKMRCTYYRSEGEKVSVNVGRFDPEQDQLEYAFATESDITGIEDPSKYQYKKILVEMSGGRTFVSVPFNKILLVKLEDKYAAIKPLSAELKYTKETWQETVGKNNVKKFTWEDYQNNKVDDTSLYRVVCEWKYWPTKLPNNIVAAKPEKK